MQQAAVLSLVVPEGLAWALIVAWLAGMGFCGLRSTVLFFRMVDELNVRRPPQDQIPRFIVTWSDWSWYLNHYGLWGRLGVWREYRHEFPDSVIAKQMIICQIAMLVLLVVAGFSLLSLGAAGIL